MDEEYTADIVNIVQKSRVEEGHPDLPPSKETWVEIEVKGREGKVSEKMAEYLWQEFGIDVEEKGVEVVKSD